MPERPQSLQVTAAEHALLLALLARHLPGRAVRAFGSRVVAWPGSRGLKAHSDLDLACSGRPSDQALAELRAELEDSDLPWRVDLCCLDDLPAALRALVERQGVLLQDSVQAAAAPDLPVLPVLPVLPMTRLRLTALARADLPLPDYAGSLLRGAFGAALRRTACMTNGPDCKACALWRSCPYPAVFETPPAPTQFGQQFSAVPNPYVIEPPPIGLRRVAAGQALVFHLLLFGEATLRQLPLIVHAWQRALQQGLGRERIACDLVEVAAVAPGGEALPVWDADSARVLPPEAGWATLAPPPAPPHLRGLTLRLHTPLRLQHDGHALGPQDLSVRSLLAQLLRRLNLVLDLHCGIRPAPFDAPALLAAAQAGLHDDRSGLHWKDWTRYSARQRQEMTLGGVLGPWHLAGDAAVLAQLWPWLWLGQWLHLGKNATMGMGGYSLEASYGRDTPPPMIVKESEAGLAGQEP